MSETGTGETIADKAKAQIDALKTKEGRDALKEKAKEGLASATAAAKEQIDALKTKEGRDALKEKAKEGFVTAAATAQEQFNALKTKEGRSQLVAKVRAMPLKKKIGGGILVAFVFICLIRLPSCLLGGGMGGGTGNLIANFDFDNSLRTVSHVHTKPVKGKFYLNDGDRMRVTSSADGMLLVVAAGQDAETFLFQGLKKDPLLGSAIREAERVAPIIVEPCEEYSDGEFLHERVYEYLGTKEVELRSGRKALRRFRECSVEDTQTVLAEIQRRAKAATNAWLAENLFEYDLDVENHIFVPKSMNAKVYLEYEPTRPLEETRKGKERLRAYSAARKAKDIEAGRKAVGIYETASKYECEERLKEFSKQNFRYVVRFADESAVKEKGGAICLRFFNSVMARPSVSLQIQMVKDAAKGNAKIDKGEEIDLHEYHMLVNPKDKDVIDLLKTLSKVTDNLNTGGTMEERQKFFYKTVRKYMDSH